MKVLIAFTLLSTAWAICGQRSECSPGFLQQQQTMNVNTEVGTNNLSSIVYENINRVLEPVLNQLYEGEEGENLMSQLRTCESQRVDQLLGVGTEMSLVASQILTMCNLPQPVQQAALLFTQVLNIIGPIMAPCDLDRDLAADLALAALSSARQINETAVVNDTQVGLNITGAVSLTERLYDFADSLGATFPNFLQSLADWDLLNTNQVPVIIELMISNLTLQAEQIYIDLLTNLGSDPTALSTTKNNADEMISGLEDELHSLQVPQEDIQTLIGTLQSMRSKLDSAISILMDDPTAMSSAENTLVGLTSLVGDWGLEVAQIMIHIVTQNVDEFCASRNNSTNST